MAAHAFGKVSEEITSVEGLPMMVSLGRAGEEDARESHGFRGL
jgi:hypothetical protein